MGKFKDFLNEGKVTVKKRDLIATKDIIKGLYKDNKITEVSVDVIVDAFTQEQYNKEWVAEVMPNIALILKGKSIPSYNTIIKSRPQQWGGTKKSYLAVLNSIGIQEISRGKFEFTDSEPAYTSDPQGLRKEMVDDAIKVRDIDAKINIMTQLFGPSSADAVQAHHTLDIGRYIHGLEMFEEKFMKDYGESWRGVAPKLSAREESELTQSLQKKFAGDIAEYHKRREMAARTSDPQGLGKEMLDDAIEVRDAEAKIDIMRQLFGPSERDKKRAYHTLDIGRYSHRLEMFEEKFMKDYGESWRGIAPKLSTKEESALTQSLQKKFAYEIAEYHKRKRDAEQAVIRLYLEHGKMDRIEFNGVIIGNIDRYEAVVNTGVVEEVFIKLIGKDATNKLKNGLSTASKSALFEKNGLSSHAGNGNHSSKYRFLERSFIESAEYLSRFMEVSPKLDNNYTKPGTISVAPKAEPKRTTELEVGDLIGSKNGMEFNAEVIDISGNNVTVRYDIEGYGDVKQSTVRRDQIKGEKDSWYAPSWTF